MKSQNVMPTDRLFLKNKNRLMCDWSALFEHLYREGSISKADAKLIITTASKFFGRLISQ